MSPGVRRTFGSGTQAAHAYRVDQVCGLVCRSSRSRLQERDLTDHGCESVYAPTGPQGGFPEYAVFDSSKVDILEIRRR